MRARSWLGMLALIVGLALALWWYRTTTERILYRGGPILTMDGENRVVEALLTDGDSIVAVGPAAAAAGGRARIVDLDGHALLPGFIDAHGHFPGAGIYELAVDLNSPPIGAVDTMDDLVSRLRARAEETPSDGWVIGMSYDDTLLAERRHPTRADLDRVSAEHPVAAVHISGHLAAVNGRALEALGLSRDTPNPAGGRLRRDPDTGALDGVLEETAMQPVLDRVTNPSALEGLAIVREAARRYLRAGVTTAQNGLASQRQIELLSLLSRVGVIPLRLIFWPAPDVADAILAGAFSFSSYDERWVRLGAVKLVADGSIQAYTGYLTEPYHVPPGDDPAYRGYPRMSRAALRTAVARFHAAGMQLAIHGNGDAAIDDILDAVAAAQQTAPRVDSRPVVVHAQMTRPDQLDRMRALGVIPSFFALHTYYWGDRHWRRFMGPARAARMSPARSAADRGVRFTMHCDSPVVPMEPLRLVWSAVERRSTSGARIGEAERIAPMEALRAVTIDAAYQHREETIKGSLEPGKLADLVILSESPLDATDGIDRIRVLETIISGRSVYRAPLE